MCAPVSGVSVLTGGVAPPVISCGVTRDVRDTDSAPMGRVSVKSAGTDVTARSVSEIVSLLNNGQRFVNTVGVTQRKICKLRCSATSSPARKNTSNDQ